MSKDDLVALIGAITTIALLVVGVWAIVFKCAPEPKKTGIELRLEKLEQRVGHHDLIMLRWLEDLRESANGPSK